jgi:hypothetical protein
MDLYSRNNIAYLKLEDERRGIKRVFRRDKSEFASKIPYQPY